MPLQEIREQVEATLAKAKDEDAALAARFDELTAELEQITAERADLGETINGLVGTVAGWARNERNGQVRQAQRKRRTSQKKAAAKKAKPAPAPDAEPEKTDLLPPRPCETCGNDFRPQRKSGRPPRHCPDCKSARAKRGKAKAPAKAAADDAEPEPAPQAPAPSTGADVPARETPILKEQREGREEKVVLEAIEAGINRTVEIRDITGLEQRPLSRALSRLRELKLIDSVGAGAGARWQRVGFEKAPTLNSDGKAKRPGEVERRAATPAGRICAQLSVQRLTIRELMEKLGMPEHQVRGMLGQLMRDGEVRTYNEAGVTRYTLVP